MHRAEDRLQRYLQRFVSNIILGNSTDSSLQDDHFPDVIYQASTSFLYGLQTTLSRIWLVAAAHFNTSRLMKHQAME